MTSAAVVRQYEPEDLDEVLSLLRESLGESEVNQRTAEWFSWKHLDNPFGPSIMLVAADQDGLVGFRAFMRWELDTAEGERIRCARPVDTATHPRARRLGIFRTLTLRAVEAARGDGIDLLFNTPNPSSKAGYMTMGWVDVGRIGVLVRPRVGALSKRHRAIPSVRGSAPWNDQSIVNRPALGFRTPRTPQYLRWRFRHPFAPYMVLGSSEGLVILRRNMRDGRGELVVSDVYGANAGQVLRQAARSTDADYLVSWFGPGSPERRHARSAGMIPVPAKTALTLVAHPLRDGLSVADMRRWDLALSDLELL